MKFEVNAETEDSIFSSFLDLAYNIVNTPEQKKELELIKNLQDIVDKKNNLIRFVADVLKKSGDWILLNLALDVCVAAYYLKTTKMSIEEYQKNMKEFIGKLTGVKNRFWRKVQITAKRDAVLSIPC